MDALLFGDIFRFREEEYVYLASGDGVDFAARILNTFNTNQIVELDNRKAMGHGANRTNSNPLYCYVILQTDEYKNQAAHFKDSQYDSGRLMFEKTGSLCAEDQQEIKKKIIDPASPIPLGLRDIILNMDI
ncbi:MAG: hypothetical protein WC668_03380 [Patescibacteria group bacterium]|jgi:hypothetical protein